MSRNHFGIRGAQDKAFRQIRDEIWAAQVYQDGRLGGLSGMTCVARFIPGFLFHTSICMAARSVRMAMRYGTVSATAVGMFGHRSSPLRFIPLTGSAVAVTVGGIVSWPAARFVARPTP